MQQRIVGLIGMWLVACAALAAAEFWDTKPFLEWSDREAQKVLADSPWAAVVSVALPPQLPAAAVAGGGGGRGGGDDISFGPGPRRIRVGLSWRSAMPLKRAVVRMSVGQRGEPSAENQEFLARAEPSYVIAMSGLPGQYTRPGSGTTIEAFLRRDGKPPIPAGEAATQKGPEGMLLLIGFPRTDPVAIEDGDVEFVFKVDRLEVKRKFKLRDMMFEGKLEL